MRLGIMQPYFLPALGYFDLIHVTDAWIVFDTPQYRRKSWMCRNRVLHPREGWQYIRAQTTGVHRDTRICDVTLSPAPWGDALLRKLSHYARHAPHYDAVEALLRASFAAERTSLSRLAVDLLIRFAAYLDLDFEPRLWSELAPSTPLGEVGGPGEWALRICEALGATQYVNPPGGEAIFDRDAYAASNIDLIIRRFDDMPYAPRSYDYIPTLSIVDVLMWNPPTVVKAYLDEQRAQFLAGLAARSEAS